MKPKWIVPSFAALGVLVAFAAFAADTAKQPAPEVQKHVVRVEVDGDDEGEAWTWEQEDDGLGLYAFGDEEDVVGGDDPRIVIRKRMGPGMGMGPGAGRGPGRHRAAGFRLMAAIGRLDLTDAQRTKLAEVHEKQQRRAIQARADLEVAQLDLRKLMRAETPNATSINAQIDKVSKLRADSQKSRVGALLEARALLTPEQQKQLRDEMTRGPGKRTMMFHGSPQAGQGKPN